MRAMIVVAALSIGPACTSAPTTAESPTPIESPTPSASRSESDIPISLELPRGQDRVLGRDERHLVDARRRIAYRYQTGDDETTEIYVMHADGSHQTNLIRNEVPDWGPDVPGTVQPLFPDWIT